MPDETDPTTGASGDASQTEMETITLNNRQITVPKSAASILKEEESSLMRGYQDKLTNERESIKKTLDEDTAWYSTHPESVWANYDPKVHGGKGYTGDESLLIIKKNEPATPVTNGKPNVSFGDDTRLKQLERELEEQKKIIEELQKSDIKRGADLVKKDRDSLLKKYPYADYETVTESLENFWIKNQRHPLESEIETIVKKKNDFVAVRVAAGKQEMITKQTATPSVSGTSPLSKKDKLPRLDDTDAWVKIAREDLAV